MPPVPTTRPTASTTAAPASPPPTAAPDLAPAGLAGASAAPLGRLPRHVAIIMDGNGRWARQRGLPRAFGHQAGARSVGAIVEECARLGIEALTLFSFSSENWKRPPEEINALMELCREYLRHERDRMVANGIRFRRIGQREGLPDAVLAALDETEAATAGGQGLALCLAVNYGSRAELTEAVRAVARRVAAGELAPDAIDEATISASLYTAGLPDPDLLIRTAGERRLSNYLLWQISYAEIHVSDALWPDFRPDHFRVALDDFARRERRYGDINAL